MKISVVIPARNEIEKLKQTIACLKSSSKPAQQIIIIDDASSKNIQQEINDPSLLINRLDEQSGPARARNAGAKIANSPVILFIDADVLVKPDTLEKLEKLFNNGEAAVVGLFSDQNGLGFFSSYKNLWIKYCYEQAGPRAALFFTSIAAIRTELFFRAGGFDEKYKRPSTEDTAFGNKLWRLGIRPLVTPEIAVVHNKRYSLFTILKTDFFRTHDLLKLKLRKELGPLRERGQTSVPGTFIFSLFTTTTALGVYFISGSSSALIGLLCASIFLNYGFLFRLYQKKGLIFCLQSAAFIPLDHLIVFLGLTYGALSFCLGKRY